MAIDISYTKVLSEDSSFQLVRTNPKLTGNLKLTVNESGEMWLDSINANLELAKDEYSRYPIDTAISLPANIHRFFKNGETPNEIIFGLSEKVDVYKTSKDYKDQYDFSNYFSGIKYFPSNKYEERLSYFAPLYLKKEIPNYFIILKINDPLNYTVDESKSKYESNITKSEYLVDLFKKSTIIKTFDLSENSKPGKFIREYLNSPNFPTSPLTVSFDDSEYTTWNGILVDSGILGNRGELYYSQYEQSSPLKFFEENITKGFERNGIIFPNILNLEFIFNDDTSEKYEINRYLGLYVNAIELAELDIDLSRGYAERKTWENTPKLHKDYKEYEDVNLSQKNTDGVILPYLNLGVNMEDFSNIFTDSESLYFNYLSDKHGNLHLPKLDSPYTIESTTTGQLRLSDTSINLGKFFGPAENTFLQDEGTVITNPGFSYGVIKINSELSNLDNIKIYHSNGTLTDLNGKYDELIAYIGYSLVPNIGDYYVYNDYDNIIGNDQFYFNATGQPHDIAEAITQCLNRIRNRSFTAYQCNEYVFIKCNSAGDFDTNYKLAFYSPSSYTSVNLDGLTGTNLINTLVNFKGGSKYAGNRLLINSGHYSKINNQIDNLLVQTEKGWSKIKKISGYIDLVIEENLVTAASRLNVIDSFETKSVIALELNEAPYISHKEFVIRRKFRPEFGLISLFPIKDIDFDFYASEYLNFPLIDLYQYYFIPDGLNLLDPSAKYKIIGNGKILVNDSVPTEYDSTLTTSFTVTQVCSYSILEGNPFVAYYSDLTTTGESTIFPIYDENKELQNFQGFSILKDPTKVIPQVNTDEFNLKLKYLNGVTSSEYDFYKENESSDFAVRSKIIPYITKWRIKNGLDSRDNPYRLNTELVFGRNNFSPDHSDRSQNPNNFTHEWFYIESEFNYINDPETSKLNNYYFNEKLDIEKLLSEPDYFLDYFTFTPEYNAIEVGHPQFRYSKVFKNIAGQYETFFKGFKINFKDVTNATVIGEDGKPVAKKTTTRFEDYNFSTILVPVKEQFDGLTQSPIKYRVIEHTDFKFILIVIEVAFGDLEEINNYWKEVPTSGSFTKIGASNPFATGDEPVFFTDSTKTTEFGFKLPYETVNGDYRIDFKEISGIFTGGSLSNNKIFGISDLDFENIRVGQYLSGTGLNEETIIIGKTKQSGNNSITLNKSTSITGSGLTFTWIEYVSNLSHTLIYSLRNKKYNNLLNNFSNVKLSSKLNIATAGSNGVYAQTVTSGTIAKSNNINILNYPSFLSDEINIPTTSTFIAGKNTTNSKVYFIDLVDGVIAQTENPIVNASDAFLNYLKPASENISLSVPIPSTPYTSYYSTLPLAPGFQVLIRDYFTFSFILGGEQYYEKLIEKISFTKFKQYINTLDPIIEYQTYTLVNGEPTLVTPSNLYLELPDQAKIQKINQVITNVDEDRPTQYSFDQIISYTYERAELANTVELNRYKGGYEPLVKDLLFCRSNFTFTQNDINPIKLANIRINTDVASLLTIQNFNHIKVADTKILQLESDDAYLPVYPKINEVAIGQADYFLLNSNWDWGFHHKYSNKSNYLAAAGSARVEEDENFLGKIINVASAINLEDFNVVILPESVQLENIDITQYEIVVKEGQTTLDGYINIDNILTSYFIADNIEQKFNEYLVNENQYIGNFESINQYVKEYIRLNILKLYEILTLEFYSKQNASLVSSKKVSNINNIEIVSGLNDSERNTLGYSILKTVGINKIDRLILKFSIQKPLNTGLSISPKIKIKFI